MGYKGPSYLDSPIICEDFLIEKIKSYVKINELKTLSTYFIAIIIVVFMFIVKISYRILAMLCNVVLLFSTELSANVSEILKEEWKNAKEICNIK